MKKVITIIGIFGLIFVQAQVGINKDKPDATLDIVAEKTDGSQVEGLLVPRISKEAAYNMATTTTKPQESNMVYVNDLSTTFTAPTGDNTVSDITEKGYYFWNGAKWVRIKSHSTDAVIQKTFVYVDRWITSPDAKFGTVPHYDPGFTHNPGLEKNTDYLYIVPRGYTYLWDAQENKYVGKEVGGSSLFYKENTLEDGAGKMSSIYRTGKIGVGIRQPISHVHTSGHISGGVPWHIDLRVDSSKGEESRTDNVFSTLTEAIHYANTITNNGVVHIHVHNPVESLDDISIYRDIVIQGIKISNVINLNGRIRVAAPNILFGFVEGYDMTINQNTPVAFLLSGNSQILLGGYASVNWNFTANNQKLAEMSYSGTGANAEVYLTFSRTHFNTNSHTGLGWALASPEHTGNFSISYWRTNLPPNMDYRRVVRITSADRSWQNLVGEYIAFSGLDRSNNNTVVERMRLTNSGNLGIGTTTPTVKLEVSGDIKVQGTGTTINDGNTCNNPGTISYSSGSFYGCTTPPTGTRNVWKKLHN